MKVAKFQRDLVWPRAKVPGLLDSIARNYLCNNGGGPGAGGRMVRALVALGANYLECFRGHLSEYYAGHGFVETDFYRWNAHLAPQGWDYDRHGKPDVVCRALRVAPVAG